MANKQLQDLVTTNQTAEGLVLGLADLDKDEMAERREELVQAVMDGAKLLAKSWSQVDGPFAAQHQLDDHQMVEDEFLALANRVVFLPESVEGVRFLERWYNLRLDSLKSIQDHAQAGNLISLRPEDQPEEHRDITLNDDMAAGLRLGIRLARSLLEKFPLTMTLNDEVPDDD
ncbi:hypothetical protein N7613_12505 [Pseudomonas juntendi]|uniref:hypothetical protein n=1 Tax=Pseudomonas juntendi TaxID=2666183 RepID=UPI00244C2AB5|nr:hypothetical protein [Pseudomonas juntendi]MDG9809449.1 hypothetical protein [Pseudomonas juntendi]